MACFARDPCTIRRYQRLCGINASIPVLEILTYMYPKRLLPTSKAMIIIVGELDKLISDRMKLKE